MRVITFNSQKPDTTYLQGIAAWVKGTPAGLLQVGNKMMWNGGVISEVLEIVKTTEKTITILEGYTRYDGLYFTGQRKMNKSRIVARPANEL